MAELKELNSAWLAHLTNPHHDGTTQQIDDFVQAFETDLPVLNQKKAALHQARQVEDDVWLKEQRDAVVPLLEAADNQQDGYLNAFRYTLQAHASLPDGEATRQEAKQCLQVMKDFNLSTRDPYGAESDKIIQMQQNQQAHQAFLEQVGAWTFLTKAVAAAQQVRQYLGQRALTLGEFVKGEMKTARRNTDLAIADLYQTLMAMQTLMPSDALTALLTQLKGIELYARKYYLNNATASSSESGTSGGSADSGSADDSGSDDSGSTGSGELPPSGGGEEPDNDGSGSGSGSGSSSGSELPPSGGGAENG